MDQFQEKPLSITKLLLERLFQAPDVKTYLRDNACHMEMPAFDRFICALCEELSLSRAAVITRSDIPRNYAYQLFNGIRKPSRDKVIQLAFGFGLDVDGAQELLKIARQAPLYPKIPRDIVILRCLHEKRSVWDAQNTLDDMQLTLLGREDKNE
ncbi:MAG: helix-turn-helix transcriptional regulator [Eubacteriales bacterium]|jgi:transcriptional regulator with XRE-family HTH domain|nr:helix-turn-helix transcriptional regulator [Eubacteriales bacterium]